MRWLAMLLGVVSYWLSHDTCVGCYRRCVHRVGPWYASRRVSAYCPICLMELGL